LSISSLLMVVLVVYRWVVSLPKRGKALSESVPRLGLGIKKPARGGLLSELSV
jgi:hypothetical protein